MAVTWPEQLTDGGGSLRYRRLGRRRRRFGTHAFFLTCAIFALFAAWSFLIGTDGHAETGNTLLSRHVAISEANDEACRLVHRANVVDKCAYIHKHCPVEEPGFLTYLDLYYCRLGHVTPFAFVLLVLWLAVLFSTIGIAASDFFCINLSTIATILGMSESLAGVTFLAFGNGSPDVFSTFAAMSTNSSSLAIGELIGAAGFITAVVAGSMALVRPFRVARKSFIRDVGFFAVAAAFSMGFLSDGHLHLWECLAMVAYYFFYVGVVVIWHWRTTRRARRRQKEAAARGHYVVPGHEGAEIEEGYRDDPDDELPTARPLLRASSSHDLRLLEDAGIPRIEEPPEDDEDQEREWLGEISSNMRLGPRRHRSNTITPVRPSLVGALEFQAVLSSLQKSRNIQPIHLNARRHSDDLLARPPNGAVSAPAVESERDVFAEALAVPLATRPALQAAGGRARAVSTSDIGTSHGASRFLQAHRKVVPDLLDITEDESGHLTEPSSDASSARDDSLQPESSEPFRSAINDGHNTFLAPQAPSTPRAGSRSMQSPNLSPGPHARGSLNLGAKSPLDSLHLPEHSVASSHSSKAPSLHLPPSASADSDTYLSDDANTKDEDRAPRWWPGSILPTPANLLSTLFPTLYHFKSRTWWEIALGIVAAPSVFLLTITLPVVEVDRGEEDKDIIIVASPVDDGDPVPTSPSVKVTAPDDSNGEAALAHTSVNTGLAGDALQAAASNSTTHHAGRTASANHPHHSTKSPKTWNRWLTITQLYLAPLMIVAVIYTQYLTPAADDKTSLARTLVRPCLIALLISTLILVAILWTSTSTHRPGTFIPFLSAAGFVVSIAWISTIASQVVAVLKTFAIILNMSHAILGLTVFAVGNSLGDLVADITVARLGYPVMALSACFGGPMLNILLGIGLSGSWILIGQARRRQEKHPDRKWKTRSYEIEVGDTLIVSGVTLLVGLIGLLVAVPLNGWMMSRRIAWALIALWCVATVVNVVLEVVGVGGNSGGTQQ